MQYKWDDIRFFLAIWRTGSLLGAARALRVNSSTVGRRLDALEEGLGVQLFERTPEGAIATLSAERLIGWAEAVEQSHLGFEQALSGLETEAVGSVHVTGPPGLIDHFIAPALSALRDRHPRLTVILDASIGYADLLRGEADIALRATRPTRGDLVSLKLGPFGSAVIGRPGMTSVCNLGDLPWMQWGDDLLHIPDARWVSAHVPDSAIVLRTSSFASQVEAARGGFGVFLAAAPFASLSGLCAVPLTGPAARAVDAHDGQSVYLVGHQALRRVPRVSVVWDFLKERILAA